MPQGVFIRPSFLVFTPHLSAHRAGTFLAFSVALSPCLSPTAWEGPRGHVISFILLLPRRKLRLRKVWGFVPGSETKVALFNGSVVWSMYLSAPGRHSLPVDLLPLANWTFLIHGLHCATSSSTGHICGEPDTSQSLPAHLHPL